MHRGTWKNGERIVARFFGAERTPLSGIASGHTASDSLHPKLFIENKHYKKMRIWGLWEKTKLLARKEKKLPVLTSKVKGKKGFLITVHCDDLDKFIKIYKEDKDGTNS